ncbi:MAG: hypothetical protein A3B25_00135 [Candidatus Ryanbacteria bacterium RIFCSPLOWO2_01_FULL_48_26]|uniref:Glycosyl transferase family 1 n=1 Tax=Candidatus Ryanbacteria bacterium RIFCSPLOWO2_01_FULL_48_26 TaxID=1802126 RepID=A0A1G2GTY0_9BACT|nr:MAG: hypothetical protein A3B25_00135 [Candidatus Ryanbacteria bacterium RIFCSPLOWO2_01_FULL_48_26]
MNTKLLFVITQGELGGAQRYVFDLAANLKGAYEITVVIGTDAQPLKGKLQNAGIDVLVANNLVRDIRPLNDLLAILELKKISLNLKPDIIHLNSSKAGVIGSIAARLAGIKNVIFTAHGFAFLEPHNWFVKKIYFWAEKMASYFRKKIITVSEFDRQAAIQTSLCPAQKLITIHNGIGNINFASREATRNFLLTTYNLQLNSFIIGTIAHDYPTKDLPTLRQAFALVKREYPNTELVIIGRGGTTDEIPDASKFLPAFDVYVCSSVKEGFPYSILEAMAAGLPIVATRMGGIPEMITDGQDGLLVPPKNPKAIAQAIKSLIKNPELAKQLGQNARQAVQKFSILGMLNETVNVYRSLIANR